MVASFIDTYLMQATSLSSGWSGLLWNTCRCQLLPWTTTRYVNFFRYERNWVNVSIFWRPRHRFSCRNFCRGYFCFASHSLINLLLLMTSDGWIKTRNILTVLWIWSQEILSEEIWSQEIWSQGIISTDIYSSCLFHQTVYLFRGKFNHTEIWQEEIWPHGKGLFHLIKLGVFCPQ